MKFSASLSLASLLILLLAAFGSARAQHETGLVPQDGASERFGLHVASAENYVVDAAPDVGGVYVFEQDGGVWTQTSVSADDLPQNEPFGGKIAAHGDRFAIADHGAVYVFRRSAGGWGQEAKLVPALYPPNGTGEIRVEGPVDLSGDLMAVVVEHRIDEDGNTYRQQTVHIYEYATTWSEKEILLRDGLPPIRHIALVEHQDGYPYVFVSAGNAVYAVVAAPDSYGAWQEVASAGWQGHMVGHSLASDGETAVAGAPTEYAYSQQYDYSNRGMAFMWGRHASRLEPEEENSQFGRSVGVDGERVFVSAPTNADEDYIYVYNGDRFYQRVHVSRSHADKNYLNQATLSASGGILYVATLGEIRVLERGVSTDPAQVDFGETYIGSPTSHQVEVRLFDAAPQEPLTITGFVPNDVVTSTTPVPFTLTGSEWPAKTIDVVFNPRAPIDYDTYLVFEHDGPGGRDSIRVQGIGRANARLTTVGTQTVGTNFVNVLFRASGVDDQSLDFPADYISRNPGLFELRDNGQWMSPTAPESFYHVEKLANVPNNVRTVLLLDRSLSVAGNLDEIQDAAHAFVDNLPEGQELALYVFAGDVTLIQDFTRDRAALHTAIDQIQVGGPSTALYRALLEGLSRWEDLFVLTDEGAGHVDVHVERGYLVVLSDGRDTAGGATRDDVISARGTKRVFSVGYDYSGDLGGIANAGSYSVGQLGNDELPGVFVDVQERIEGETRSFYWLSYASPRRFGATHELEICVDRNVYREEGACAVTSYSSEGFTDPVRGVYVNRSFEHLYGVDGVDVTAEGVTLTATTIVGLYPPSYEWSSSDPETVTVEPIEGTNQAVATLIQAGGATAMITVRDTANDLEATVITRSESPISVEDSPSDLPAGYVLEPNYPNPFNPTTTIRFGLPKAENVSVVVYNVLGERVSELLGEQRGAGYHEVRFEADGLATGVYFVQVQAGSFQAIRKMMLLR